MKRYHCCCADGLHEVNSRIELQIEHMPKHLHARGRTQTWMVPRVYVAVHGMPVNLDARAVEFRWKPVDARSRV